MSGFQSLLKSSNYKIVLNSAHQNIEFFSTEINIPGITVGSIEKSFQGMKRIIPGDSLLYNGVTATVLVDEELKILDEILNTFNFTHNPESNIIRVNPVLFDMFVYITTNKNNPQFKFWFRDAWIETFSDLPFMSTTTDENPLTTTVGFRYNYYTFERV